ncbi:hypothetical protein [Desulfolutivibrio sp.]|uniref:hypothetical protein n=1 Tax=Desulfolutivibrio sp. TaxID=2773296 RepID=UPI002F96E80A
MNTSDKVFSPSDFLKGRRPELFSDTIQTTEEYLEKDQLEFHLDTLTQRQQEYQFEHFCRRLAERELCPNLVPQTGPMGGGDAKVDTETYPVADEVALRWYETDPKAAKERWGFAISAKKDWQSKVKSDVQKIAKTNRGYSLIYFMTNQSVSSKKRVDVEDSLHTEWDIPVRILDRTWMIEKVFENRRWDIAFSTLEISRPQTNISTSNGPIDTERLAELKELESFIDDPGRYRFSKYQLIEDCLQTALLARGLAYSRMDVDGRFERALRIAREHGSKRDIFRVLYNKAWTAYWWFDDFNELDHLYTELADLVVDFNSSWQLEKLVNLWIAGVTWIRQKKYYSEINTWKERTGFLRNALLIQAKDQTRPTNALWARTQLVFMDLNDAIIKPEIMPDILNLMSGVLDEAQGLLDYPVAHLIQIIEDMSIIAKNFEEYDKVLEKAITLQSSRVGESEQGKMRLRFGHNKLESGKPYSAIEQYGKAQFLLAKSEHILLFIETIYSLALAYERAGLLWAARANLLQALDRTMHEHLKGEPILLVSLSIIRKLYWIELRLGRVPCILGWIRWLGILYNVLELENEKREELNNEFVHMDCILGILVLKSDPKVWGELEHVAGLFDKLGLFMSRASVLFTMGYEDMYRSEYGENDQDLQHYFSLWLAQPANDDLPVMPDWLLGETVEMKTNILGCEIKVVADNKTNSIVLGEAILAFAESFMASTIMMHSVFSSRSNLSIFISSDDSQSGIFSCVLEVNDCGESQIKVIHHNRSLSNITTDEAYNDSMQDLLVMLISEINCSILPEQLDTLFGKEQVQNRAFWTTSMPLAFDNIFGDSPRYSIKDWEEYATDERLPFKRAVPWTPTAIHPFQENSKNIVGLHHRKEKNLSKPFDSDSFKHSDIMTLSVINTRLWDQAKWRGTGYMWDPEIKMPIMVLIFENFPYGEMIFNGWKNAAKNGILDDFVDISIIRGVQKTNPAHYRVAIGSNLNSIQQITKNSSRIVLNTFRLNTMEPQRTDNLTIFLKCFEDAGSFKICPGSFLQHATPQSINQRTGFIKKRLKIVNAWEIGRNDPLLAALNASDDPIIPASTLNPPCHDAYELIRNKKKFQD